MALSERTYRTADGDEKSTTFSLKARQLAGLPLSYRPGISKKPEKTKKKTPPSSHIVTRNEEASMKEASKADYAARLILINSPTLNSWSGYLSRNSERHLSASPRE